MSVSGPSTRPIRSSRRVWVLTALVVLAVYVAANLAFAQSGRSKLVSGPGDVTNGVNFAIGLTAVNPAKGEMTLRMIGIPEGEYVDESSGSWAKSVKITMPFVTSGATTTEVAAGTPVGGTRDVSILIDGDELVYPFDRYRFGGVGDNAPDPESAPITVPAPLLTVQEVDASGNPTDAVVPVGLFTPDGLQGWSEVWVAEADNNTLSALLTVKRSGGMLTFVLVILSLMVVIAVLASLVARSVVLKRRPIEVGMTSWFAALLFALIPLRTNLPDAPPIGAWIDVAVFYWVEITLLIAMSVFVGSWLKYRKPPVDESQ